MFIKFADDNLINTDHIVLVQRNSSEQKFEVTITLDDGTSLSISSSDAEYCEDIFNDLEANLLF